MFNTDRHPIIQDGRTYDQWKAYGQSKTANILFSVSLAEKLGSKGVLSFSLHPGVILDHLPQSVMDNPMVLERVCESFERFLISIF